MCKGVMIHICHNMHLKGDKFNLHNFDKAFDDFLERKECDQASDALYTIIRAAFMEGWRAAGGNPLPARKVIRVDREQSRSGSE